MRKVLFAFLALAWAAPAAAQTTANLPVTCSPTVPGQCVRATPAVNPDGTTIGTSAPASRSSIATGQISVGTASTLIAAARPGRGSITLTLGAAVACAFGNTGVSTTTGFPLQPIAGASVTLDTTAAIYGACATAATTVGFVENF
jgi:hypothetical protein